MGSIPIRGTIALSSNGRTADFGSANLRSSRSGAMQCDCSITFNLGVFMKTMFVSAVAVLMFAACAKNAEEAQQGESAAIQADTTFAAEKAATDSVKAVEVKAEVPDAK
jgi:hypothetical protein